MSFGYSGINCACRYYNNISLFSVNYMTNRKLKEIVKMLK